MGTIATFVLGVTAFLATIVTIFNPFYEVLKALEGKEQSDINQMFENATAKQWISGCFRYGCFFVLALLLKFVLEPFFVIAALVTHTGNVALGYVALAIVAFGWIESVRTMRSNKSKKPAAGAVVTAEGRRVEGTVVEVDQELPKVNWFTLYVRRAFFALPVFYLWYIFL